MSVTYCHILQENDDDILLETSGYILSEEECTVSEGGVVFREDLYRKVGFRIGIVLPKPEIEFEFEVSREEFADAISRIELGERLEYPIVAGKPYVRPYDDEEELLTILAELI